VAGPAIDHKSFHTQGWVHCHTPATDASGPVKAVMDNLWATSKSMTLPPMSHRPGLLLNMCGAWTARHRHPGDPPDRSQAGPQPDPNVCEIPTTVASCPPGPSPTPNKSLVINEEKCNVLRQLLHVCPGLPGRRGE